MCYHNSLSKSAQELKNRFNVEFERAEQFNPIYYAGSFGRPLWPVITKSQPDTLQLFEWSLLPEQKVTPETKTKLTRFGANARSEEVEDKPMFRKPFELGQRCIVPSTGFWEWRKEMREVQGKTKVTSKEMGFPYYIQDREREIMPMAGLYSFYLDVVTGQKVGSFAIFTCSANDMMMYIHNKPAASDTPRMPVILKEEDIKDWLNPDLPLHEVKRLMAPYPKEQMKAYTVKSPIRNPNNSLPTIIDYEKYEGVEVFG